MISWISSARKGVYAAARRARLPAIVKVAQLHGYHHEEESARAELRLLTPICRKVYNRPDISAHFRELLAKPADPYP